MVMSLPRKLVSRVGRLGVPILSPTVPSAGSLLLSLQLSMASEGVAETAGAQVVLPVSAVQRALTIRAPSVL